VYLEYFSGSYFVILGSLKIHGNFILLLEKFVNLIQNKEDEWQWRDENIHYIKSMRR